MGLRAEGDDDVGTAGHVGRPPRAAVEYEADEFFIGLLGQERTPEWCLREVVDTIGRIRRPWG